MTFFEHGRKKYRTRRSRVPHSRSHGGSDGSRVHTYAPRTPTGATHTKIIYYRYISGCLFRGLVHMLGRPCCCFGCNNSVGYLDACERIKCERARCVQHMCVSMSACILLNEWIYVCGRRRRWLLSAIVQDLMCLLTHAEKSDRHTGPKSVNTEAIKL